jgi:hypothetical protein
MGKYHGNNWAQNQEEPCAYDDCQRSGFCDGRHCAAAGGKIRPDPDMDEYDVLYVSPFSQPENVALDTQCTFPSHPRNPKGIIACKPEPAGQPRYMSLIEAVTNSATGFAVSVGIQAWIFPFFGIHVELATNVVLVCIFTVFSTARSYLVRRFFDWIGRV